MARWFGIGRLAGLRYDIARIGGEGFVSRKWLPRDPLKRIDLSPSQGGVFHIILVKPTRYDDEGYAIHWYRSSLPSNSLACLNGIALDCAARRVLGAEVEIRVSAFDESCDVVDYRALIERIRGAGQRLFLCLVGVQSNQFPRSMDLAQPFLAAKVPVCMGGFHVSGCISMLDGLTPELVDAQKQGISLFAGEAECQRFDTVVQDAWSGTLQPIYDHQDDFAALAEQPLPELPYDLVRRNITKLSSIDLGRGCPFTCSFCCIINVQGRKSRWRSVDDLERFLRHATSQGRKQIFITDDNFARNKNWEAYLDRLIALREGGLTFTLVIQVDTLCHKIPGFIDKSVAAGVTHVFVGLENINPDNLLAMKKRQNKITEYREMLLQWKRHPVVVWGAYIIGMPNDTRESILRDVDIIKRELPIDLLNASILTPLPGSEDHRTMLDKGEWMDPDLNRYDLAHRVIHHPNMTDDELDRTYDEVWRRYYTFDHMKTVLRRARALGSDKRYTTVERLLGFGVLTRLYDIRSYDMGLIRRMKRTSRRPGLPLEPALLFYPKRIVGEIVNITLLIFHAWRLVRAMKEIWRDPASLQYRDEAITSPDRGELDSLELFQSTRGGQQVVQLVKRREQAREQRAASRAGLAGSGVGPT